MDVVTGNCAKVELRAITPSLKHVYVAVAGVPTVIVSYVKCLRSLCLARPFKNASVLPHMWTRSPWRFSVCTQSPRAHLPRPLQVLEGVLLHFFLY